MKEVLTSSPRTTVWNAANDFFNNFTIVVYRFVGKMAFVKN